MFRKANIFRIMKEKKKSFDTLKQIIKNFLTITTVVIFSLNFFSFNHLFFSVKKMYNKMNRVI